MNVSVHLKVKGGICGMYVVLKREVYINAEKKLGSVSEQLRTHSSHDPTTVT